MLLNVISPALWKKNWSTNSFFFDIIIETSINTISLTFYLINLNDFCRYILTLILMPATRFQTRSKRKTVEWSENICVDDKQVNRFIGYRWEHPDCVWKRRPGKTLPLTCEDDCARSLFNVSRGVSACFGFQVAETCSWSGSMRKSWTCLFSLCRE